MNISNKQTEKYWIKKLSNKETVSDSRQPILKSFSVTIDNNDLAYFNKITNKNRVAQYTIILSVLSVLLKRYFESFNNLILSESIITGNEKNNLVVIETETELDDTTYKNYFQLVKSEMQDVLSNSDYDEDSLFEKLNQSIEDYSVFGFLMNSSKKLKCKGLLFEIDYNEKSGITIEVTYNENYFRDYQINHLTNNLKKNIILLEENINLNVLEYKLIDEADEEKFKNFNDTSHPYPSQSTLVDLFEDQVLKTPDSVAVVFGDTELSYSELNCRANRLGHYLRDRFCITCDDLVGIKLERSDQMLVVLLGILKSGGAYVPIDTSYPAERILYIEKDSNCKVVIDAEALREFEKLSDGYSDGNPDRISTADDLAYIIYTSGTTGNPKGVMIEHRSACELIGWSKKEFDADTFDVVYAPTSYCFDLSVYELFYPLSIGKKVRILTNGLDIMTHLVEEDRVLINTVPSVVTRLVELGISWSGVSVLNMAGEPIPTSLIRKLPIPKLTVYNLYGPSEDTTYSTYYKITDREIASLPIGKPITNTQVYILDASLNVVPVGVTGRLYVSGSGLARGYLNREDLTAEKFVSNPFTPGSRMYDTGDLGRWLDDGNIEFLGRNDHQVKIRGFRIELGEIESVILQYSDSLGQVVVEAKDSGSEKVLVAYCVCEGGLDKSALRSFLQDKLPEYMIPGYFVELASLPLTPNGKIDRKQLPGISASDVIQKEYVAPRNSTESALVSIWEEVLGVSNIGITDNFFELGGHSLVVAQVINRVYKQMGKSISFREFFSHPTIEHLSPELRESLYIPISRIEDNDFYTLTPSQHRLWILSQMEGGSLAYNMPAAVRLSGELDKELFSSAFRMLIGRHEILRTVFRMTPSGDIAQYVVGVDDYVMDFDYQDFTGSSTPEADALLYMEQRNGEVFDLEHGPLLRCSLIDVKQDDFVFLISLHHIIGDGWSIKLLVSEIITIYNSLKSGSLVSLPELKIQYRDYSIWVNDRMDDAQFGASRLFWLDQLSGELPVLDLPSFNKRPVIQTYCGASQSYDFSDSFLSKLRDFGTSRDATLFMVLMSGIKSLLHRYTGQNDIIVGTPVAGREHPDLEHQLGLYLNTLAIRSHFGDVNSFEAVLDRERQTLLGCYGHQQYPFDSLVSDLRLKRDTGRSAIFDVLVVLQNQDQVGSLMHQQELTGLEVGHYDIPVKSSQFDMSFTFAESSGLTLHIEYNTDIYDRSIIESMFGHFERLMTLAMEDPSADIASIDYLDDVQRTAIVEGFNDTSHPYPSQSTLVDLFEEQVLKTPDSVAVVFGDTELSYSELNCRANRLGHYLRDRFGITSDDLVGIKLERSDQMLVVLLGILKSGGAYVPIDTSYPAERILYIEKDSNCKVVIDAETLREFEKLSDEYSDGNPDHISTADDLAYIIYTSGTTGNPKGVMIEHNQVVDYVLTFVDYFKLNKTDSILSLATISFDTSVEEIFPILSVGGKLVMVSSNNDFEHIFSLCNEHSITTLSTNPYTLNYFNSRSNEIDTSLIRVINGGDTLKSQDIDSLINKVEIYNSYGPTETTVCASYYKIEELKENLPIGSPISNKQIYILDASLNVVPVGVTGRLYVSGSGLARGYLNREDLTAEKFVSNPFTPGSRMYDTGDLGRWLDDGNIEFLGRNDHQVKIRGFRIELGEIESVILQYSDSLRQVVVEARDSNSEKVLVAYCVCEDELDKSALRSFLQSKLPEHMIPGYFVELPSLPVTHNGKIDRKQLPGISAADVIQKEYVAPRNNIEVKLVSIWEEILEVPKIGITDNFFAVGGHSLNAIKVITRVRNEFNIDIKIEEIFKNPTIENISAILIKNSWGTIKKEAENKPKKKILI